LVASGASSEKSSEKPQAAPRKKPAKESLLDPNRSQNIAIAKKKLTVSNHELCQAITRYWRRHTCREVVSMRQIVFFNF